MAKELPYFKFEPAKWDNGNIQLCSLEAQGMYINLCCIYWSRMGDLPLKLAEQKIFRSNADAYAELMHEEIFALNDGKIVISFLDEQLSNFGGLSETKAKAAKIRWDKVRESKQVNADAMHVHSTSNAIREDKRREDVLFEKEPKHNQLDNTISLKEKSEKKIEKIEFVENSKYGSGELHFKILKFAEENKGKYSKGFYYDFLEYWTAPLQKGVNKGKELWKTKETFSLGGRLSTWNKINNQKNGSNSRESKEEYLKRVGSDIDDIFKRKEQTGNYFGIDLTRQGQSTNDLGGYSEYTNIG